VETNQRARIRAGDPDAFGLLFEECARAVYNQAFRLTGSWPAAEEAVSLTFLEAWRLRHRVEPEGGSLRPWVLGIAPGPAVTGAGGLGSAPVYQIGHQGNCVKYLIYNAGRSARVLRPGPKCAPVMSGPVT
jgi:Sigma-70 region 2